MAARRRRPGPRPTTGGSGFERIRVVIRDVNRFVELIVATLALEFTAEMKRAPPTGTPVDTGFARTNWVPRIGERFGGTAGTYDQAVAGNLSPGPQNEGEAQLLAGAYKISRGVVYITNNVDYIEDLNRGTSRQSPAEFVDEGVARAVARTVAKAGGRRT